MNSTVAAVVVTYNRKDLLAECLDALRSQSRPPDGIIIIDNASNDGTWEALDERGYTSEDNVRYMRLADNSGGAGGFCAGIEEGCRLGYDWLWLMDDDAVPFADALEQLMAHAEDTATVYGSATVNGEDLAWPVCLIDESHRIVNQWASLPEHAVTNMQPFLGFLISRRLVAQIGLPDASYFIAADDVEYCIRARRAGGRVVVIKNSRIQHPRAETYPLHLFGFRVTALRLPPWKRYYDTRNRLMTARRHYGIRLITQTIPGSLLRLFGCLLKEPRKRAQTWAFFAGFVDGLLGRKGRRHERWHIPR